MLVGFDVRGQEGMDFFIAKFLQICSNKVRSSSTVYLGRPEGDTFNQF